MATSTGIEMKYFVLSPKKQDAFGKASRDAMEAFAKSIRPTNEQLANDVESWVARIDMNILRFGKP